MDERELVLDRKRRGKRCRQGVGAVRLGHCDDLREIARGRVVPERLMVTEGLIQIDDDRAVWRRPAMNVDREVVEFRARRGIVESLLRLVALAPKDEIGARHIEKSAGRRASAARLGRIGRRLKDGLACRDRVAAHVLGKILDKNGAGRGPPGRYRAAADNGDHAILGIRRVHWALVMVMVMVMMMLMSATALFALMAVIEQVPAPMSDRCRHRRAVIAVVVFHGSVPIGIGCFWTLSS